MESLEQTITNPKHQFYLPTRVLKTISELLTITQKEYDNYVRKETNDFANWVQHVFNDQTLAEELANSTSLEEFKQVIKQTIQEDFENEEDDEEQTTTSQQKQPEENSEEKKFVGEEGTKFRDSISEKFDQAHKRLTEKTTFETSDDINKKLELVTQKEQAIKQEISEQRKKGFDLFIADMLLQKIQPLADLAKASHDQQDFNTIEQVFKEIREEIDYAKNNPLPDIKKEIDEMVAEHKHTTKQE